MGRGVAVGGRVVGLGVEVGLGREVGTGVFVGLGVEVAAGPEVGMGAVVEPGGEVGRGVETGMEVGLGVGRVKVPKLPNSELSRKPRLFIFKTLTPK